MKRIYHHYEKWEDWKDGLYRLTINPANEVLISRAARLLSDPEAFRLAALRVIDEWRYSAEVNLSNRARNRQAWLGQASCCFMCGTPEDLTKTAWHRLSPAEQDRANETANQIIAEWERRQCQSAA